MAGIELKKFIVVYLTKLSLVQTVRVSGRIIWNCKGCLKEIMA